MERNHQNLTEEKHGAKSSKPDGRETCSQALTHQVWVLLVDTTPVSFVTLNQTPVLSSSFSRQTYPKKSAFGHARPSSLGQSSNLCIEITTLKAQHKDCLFVPGAMVRIFECLIQAIVGKGQSRAQHYSATILMRLQVSMSSTHSAR